MFSEVCEFLGIMLNATFSPEIKSQTFKQRGKVPYLSNQLEEKCKCQHPAAGRTAGRYGDLQTEAVAQLSARDRAKPS